MIEFGEWLPDLGSLNNPGALRARNVIPTADGYGPFPSQVDISDALTSTAKGAISAQKSDGGTYVYAGDNAKLYSFSSGAWTNVSQTATTYNCGNNQWRMIEWGDNVIATNLVDDVQTIGLGDAQFVDLSSLGDTPPKAREIAKVRDFVVLGYINDGSVNVRKIAWSGFGDETSWPTAGTGAAAAVQSGEQEFADGGVIEAIIGGSVGYIFQKYKIRKMTYEGPPTTFRFDTLDDERGALCQGGIIDSMPMIFYIGLDGFYMILGNEIQNISDQKITKTFFKDLQPDYCHRISSAVDRTRSLVAWSYPGDMAVDGQPNKIIFYHWPTGKWSEAKLEQDILFDYLAPATGTLVDNVSDAVDISDYTVDSTILSGGQFTFAAFDTDKKLAPFSGSALDAEVDTKEVGGDGRSLITDFRPYVTDYSTITVNHIYRDSLSGTPVVQPSTSLNGSGRANFIRDARFHRIRVNITGGFSVAQGGELVLKPAGVF